jgi:3D (Asp-Asp-Asp) domain-containing protein
VKTTETKPATTAAKAGHPFFRKEGGQAYSGSSFFGSPKDGSFFVGNAPAVQTKCAECSKEEKLQRKDDPATGPTPTPAPPVTAKPSAPPSTPPARASELKYESEGATKTKWRVDFDKKSEAQTKCDEVRKLHVKADDPEKTGKLWTFYYYPLSEAEAKTSAQAEQKTLGDKYKVDIIHSENLRTYYLKVTLKCPDAVPPKAGFEIWNPCFDTEKDAKKQIKKFEDAKIEAEIFQLDTSQFSIYFKPYKNAKQAEDAGKAEAGKRGGFAEGMFSVTSSENKALHSFVYSVKTQCPKGYDEIKGGFKITAYIVALERDFPDKPQVKDPCGLKGTFSHDFLLKGAKDGPPPWGVRFEGSGISKSGKYIQYDKAKGPECFRETSCPQGAKGRCMTENVSVAVDTSLIPLGSELLIEDVGPRKAEDTGGRINGHHIDVYYGNQKTYSEANKLSLDDKKVCIKKSEKP